MEQSLRLNGLAGRCRYSGRRFREAVQRSGSSYLGGEPTERPICNSAQKFGSVAVSMLSVAYGRQMPANGGQITNLEAFQRQIFGMCRSGCAQNPPRHCCPKPPSSRLSLECAPASGQNHAEVLTVCWA